MFAPHGRLTADAFDLGQGFGLAVVADFHYAGQMKAAAPATTPTGKAMWS